MRLICPIDVKRVPELGDVVVVSRSGVHRPAIVLHDPEDDSFGRHRLLLFVLTGPTQRPSEQTPPAAHLEEDGWFWRERDLAPDEIVRSRHTPQPAPEPPPEIDVEFRALWGNPDPEAWARSFMAKFGSLRQKISEDVMQAWFANAMTAAGMGLMGSQAAADAEGQILTDDLAMALASAADGHRDRRVRRRALDALEKYIGETGDAALDFVIEVANRLRNASVA